MNTVSTVCCPQTDVYIVSIVQPSVSMNNLSTVCCPQTDVHIVPIVQPSVSNTVSTVCCPQTDVHIVSIVQPSVSMNNVSCLLSTDVHIVSIVQPSVSMNNVSTVCCPQTDVHIVPIVQPSVSNTVSTVCCPQTEWGGGRKRKNAKPKKAAPKDKFAYMSAASRNGGDGEYNPPSRSAVEMACQMKDELLRKVEELGNRLPANTLDELIDQLGGTENVAEVSGVGLMMAESGVVHVGDSWGDVLLCSRHS